MVDLSIIIVSYNAREFLHECLDSIFKNIHKLSFEVIVVDNASTDGSAEMIKEEFPQVHLIRNDKNGGFSRANNQGVEKSKGEYVLFLNPDTIIYHSTLEFMIDFMQNHPHVGASTCRVNLFNRTIDDASHRGFPTPWNSFCHFSGLSKLFPHSKIFTGYSLGWMDLSVAHPIDACAGAFMLVRRSAGQQVGWWDEDYFFYGEDLDFCYKLKEKGWDIYYVPKVSILHYKGVSGGIKSHSRHLSKATKETKINATNARFAAMKIFYDKHYKDKYPKVITNLVVWGIGIKKFFALQSL